MDRGKGKGREREAGEEMGLKECLSDPLRELSIRANNVHTGIPSYSDTFGHRAQVSLKADDLIECRSSHSYTVLGWPVSL